VVTGVAAFARSLGAGLAVLGLAACTAGGAVAFAAPPPPSSSTVAAPSPPPSPSDRDAIAARFASDPDAASLALTLLDVDRDVVDVLPPERFDGGYRGHIQLVPELPVATYRKQLAWVAGALHDFDDFFAAVAKHAAPRYRWQGLTLRFFRSVGNTTPNAFAEGWTVSYNVNGSIDTTADRARETLFHETFHLNDADHGDWSPAHVAAIQRDIEHKCGTRSACLAPYAPTQTMVRGGTYYAFQPGNDAHEYAAEVALRWYREQRAVVRGERPVHPAFKCGPGENRRAWEAIAAEFFGGVDLTPPC
jgi:hypothetical protein